MNVSNYYGFYIFLGIKQLNIIDIFIHTSENNVFRRVLEKSKKNDHVSAVNRLCSIFDLQRKRTVIFGTILYETFEALREARIQTLKSQTRVRRETKFYFKNTNQTSRSRNACTSLYAYVESFWYFA